MVFRYSFLLWQQMPLKKILIRNGESKSDERNVLLVTTYRKAKKAVKSLNNNSFKDYRLVGLVFTDRA